MWLDEKLHLIQGFDGLVVIEASNEWGTNEIVAELGTPSKPLVWLDLATVGQPDDVDYGIQFADAVRRALGSPLFGYGLSIEYNLSVFKRFNQLLGPFVVAITAADRDARLVELFLDLALGGNTLVLVYNFPPDVENLSRRTKTRVTCFGRSDLALDLATATMLAGPKVQTETVAEILRSSGGAYLTFVSLMSEAIGVPLPAGLARDGPQGIGRPTLSNVREILDALVSRKRWVEALELAIHDVPDKIEAVIDRAGDAFFERGLFAGFWRLLSKLPEGAYESERVLFWLLSAGLAVGKQDEVVIRVEAFLRMHEAPQLRALYAASGLSRDGLSDAERAFRASNTAVTSNYYGFVLANHADPKAAIPLLRQSLDSFEREKNHHRMVSSAVSMSNAYICLGHYRSAGAWAQWALDSFAQHDLREELLRLHAVSLLSYAKLLLGEVEAGRVLLDSTQVSTHLYGIPSMEALISTHGDYALIQGDAEQAIRFYRIVHKQFGRYGGPYAVNDLVRAYLRQGSRELALELAQDWAALTDTSNDHERMRAKLALGTALVDTHPKSAYRILDEVLAHFEKSVNAPLFAQAGIQLARCLLSLQKDSAAREVLNRAALALGELGKSGWLLFGGPEEDIHDVWELWHVDTKPVELRFLGGQTVRIREKVSELPMRWCEILAALAHSPEGVGGERLSFQIYGDSGNMSTLKATLSKLRSIVPITSRPYRIGEEFTADFTELQRALDDGRVRDALELYRGPLLPESDAPFVVDLRAHLEEELRQAALNLGDVGILLPLARKLGDDRELWEEVRKRLSMNDPQYPIVNAHIKRIMRQWEG